MTLLATILPLLADGSEFTFNVSKVGDGLRIVTVPKLKGLQPDTTDAELAALQAALSQPLVFTISDASDPDAALAELLSKAASVRSSTADQLTAYRDAQRQAQQAAAAAAAKKAEAAKKPAKPAPVKPAAPASTTSEPADEPGIALSDVGGAEETPTASTSEPASASATAPATIDLF